MPRTDVVCHSMYQYIRETCSILPLSAASCAMESRRFLLSTPATVLSSSITPEARDLHFATHDDVVSMTQAPVGRAHGAGEVAS